MQTSQAGKDLIKQFEGFRADAYQDSVGVWTIGYGHTAAAGGLVPRAGLTISPAVGEAMLSNDLVQYENAVMSALARAPSQCQFDAMVSLCYNIGPVNFRNSSVVRLYNAGDIAGAAAAFLKWNKAGGVVLHGLDVRRAMEEHLFLGSPATVAPDLSTPPPVGTAPMAPRPVAPQKPAAPQPPIGLLSAILNILAILFKRKA